MQLSVDLVPMGEYLVHHMKKIKNIYKFFDYFGVIVFAYLVIDSLIYIQTGEYSWRNIVVLLIGIGGFLIDGYLVFIYKKK